MAKSATFKRGQRLTVHIDKMSAGGRGVARHEGLVVFVPDTAPDEDAEVELTFVKKNFAEAHLVRVTKASSMRRTPPCPVAGVCGGCNWQHISYPEQLRQKRGLVLEALAKFSGFKDIDSQLVADVIPSPTELRYRNRIQLHHSGPRIGFFKRGSHEIVDIDDCPITEEVLARELPRLRAEHAHAKAGRFEIFRAEDGSMGHRASGTSDPEDEQGATGTPFSQVNSAQNEILVQYVVAQATELTNGAPDAIYDLFSGGGNFTFPLAKAFPGAKVTAVELNTHNVERARERVKTEFPGGNLEFLEADVGKFTKEPGLAPEALVVLDPPRTGCGVEVLDAILKRKPAAIIYISCNPVTLARDLQAASALGWQLRSVQPFDMFPQTDHVETVAVLQIAVS